MSVGRSPIAPQLVPRNAPFRTCKSPHDRCMFSNSINQLKSPPGASGSPTTSQKRPRARISSMRNIEILGHLQRNRCFCCLAKIASSDMKNQQLPNMRLQPLAPTSRGCCRRSIRLVAQERLCHHAACFGFGSGQAQGERDSQRLPAETACFLTLNFW